MKRKGNIFPELVSWDNLQLACYLAARRKRFRADVAEFVFDYEYRLLRLQEQLLKRTYQPGRYRSFWIYEPKLRQISASPFQDRVVHHALCNVLTPIFDPGFVTDSFACRKGKGAHAAIDRCQYYSRRFPYVLKTDIRKYFPTIDHEILKQLIRRRIKDPDVLWLTDLVIDRGNAQEPFVTWFPGDDLFTPSERRRGLPIGNQTSQFLANVYLNPLDHFIKETLRIPGYARYVDDFVLFADSKAELHDARDAVTDFLVTLRLRLHKNKTVISRTADGVKFLGFKIYPEFRKLQKDNIRRAKRRMLAMQRAYAMNLVSAKEITQRIQSWIGHARHANTYQLRARLLRDFPFSRPQCDKVATVENFRAPLRGEKEEEG